MDEMTESASLRHPGHMVRRGDVVRRTSWILALMMAACGDDSRGTGGTDAGEDMIRVDMPPRTDSGPGPDLGEEDLGRDAGADGGTPDMARDLGTPVGNMPDGDVPDGDVPDGDVPDGPGDGGTPTDGMVPDGGTTVDGGSSMDAGSACGLVGAICPAAGCGPGQICYERGCIPGSRGDCGGFAGLGCMMGGTSSAWPCVTPAERDCVCAGPAAASFPSVCPTPPPPPPSP